MITLFFLMLKIRLCRGSISADAIENGDGGRVIVWADNTTRFTGSISAIGGDVFGNWWICGSFR